MPIAFPGTPQASTAAGATSINVPLESGIAAGEFLQILVHCIFSTPISVPAGWQVGIPTTSDGFGSNGVAYFWKWATGSEGGTSVTVNVSSSAAIDALSWRATGVDTSAPIHATATASGTSGATVAMTAPAVTTSVANAVVQRAAFSHQVTGIGVPSGQTDIGTSTTGAPFDRGTTRATFATQASAGASGTVDFVADAGSANRAWVALTIALKPAAGSGVTVPGTTLTASATLTPGAATAGATVAGATLTASAALVPGAAAGGIAVTAEGVTLAAVASLVPGDASGAIAAGVDGQMLTVGSSLVPGSATGHQAVVVDGLVLDVSVLLLPGTAEAAQAVTVEGVILPVAAVLTGGDVTVGGAVTVPGKVLAAVAALQPGTVEAAQAVTVEGGALGVAASLVAGAVDVGGAVVVDGQVLTVAAVLVAGGAASVGGDGLPADRAWTAPSLTRWTAIPARQMSFSQLRRVHQATLQKDPSMKITPIEKRSSETITIDVDAQRLLGTGVTLTTIEAVDIEPASVPALTGAAPVISSSTQTINGASVAAGKAVRLVLAGGVGADDGPTAKTARQYTVRIKCATSRSPDLVELTVPVVVDDFPYGR